NATVRQVLDLMESLMETQPLLADRLIISYAGTTPWSPIDKAIPLARTLADRSTRAVLEVPADLLTEPPPAWPHHRPVDRKGRPTFTEATRAKVDNTTATYWFYPTNRPPPTPLTPLRLSLLANYGRARIFDLGAGWVLEDSPRNGLWARPAQLPDGV